MGSATPFCKPDGPSPVRGSRIWAEREHHRGFALITATTAITVHGGATA